MSFFHSSFGFGWNTDSTADYILHLAFVDLLFCVQYLAVHGLHLSSGGWHHGELACLATVMFNFGLSLLDWLTLSLISCSRCVNVNMPPLRNRVSYSKVAILMLWALAGFLVWVASTLKNVRHGRS